MQLDYKVTLAGRSRGADNRMVFAKREFVVRQMSSPAEAERAVLRAAPASGMDEATVLQCVPWFGVIDVPHGALVR
jgi:hypothetical protein